MKNIKEYTEERKAELKQHITDRGLKPCLVVIQVGDKFESNSYIKGKKRDCEEVGIECVVKKYNENISHNGLVDVVTSLNEDENVHGIILQLPVPKHINVGAIQDLISPLKDVDGFNIQSIFRPCTPAGIIKYLKRIGYKFEYKDALVIGRSDIVGKPLADMLTDLNCTVTLAHSKTLNLVHKIKDADIVFTCIDKIEYFSNYWDFDNYTDIVDIGLGLGKDGKLHGNLDHRAVKVLKSRNPERICISGIGGVGLLTRLALVENVVSACDMQRKRGE